MTKEEAAERDIFTREWEPWNYSIGGEEVQRCPFCGYPAPNDSEVFGEGNEGCRHVTCSNCGASGPVVRYMSAIDAWNRRADDDLYKKGYKDGWNSCVKDKADGWMIDYI